MADVAAAAARALRAGGDYVLVTGRPTAALTSLIDAAQRHAVSAGPMTRLSVAAGVQLGGHRAVAVVDAGCAFDAEHGALAFTQSPAAARTALRAGWAIVQPSMGDDVATLFDLAPRPTLVLLADAGEEPAVLPPDAPPLAPRGLRTWQAGELATLVAAGAAVEALVRIAARLEARGVPVTAIEVAVLGSNELVPLIGGDALFVGGAAAAGALGEGAWDASLHRVEVVGVDDADLMGGVLSHVRTS